MKATLGELRRVLAGAGFARAYGFRLAAAADGECTVEVPFDRSLERPGGIVAGPIFMAAADAATWLAILTRLGPADRSVTVDMKTAFLAAARQESFHCRARVLKWGRRLIYAVAECVSPRGRLLTHHTVIYARADEATEGRRRKASARGMTRG